MLSDKEYAVVMLGRKMALCAILMAVGTTQVGCATDSQGDSVSGPSSELVLTRTATCEILFAPGTQESGVFDANCYGVVDIETGWAAVIDPGVSTAPLLLSDLRRRNIEIKYILLTHAHVDHVGGLADLYRSTDAEVVTNAVELPWLPEQIRSVIAASAAGKVKRSRIRLVRDGDVVQLGRTPIELLLTPGHTVGSQCYHLTSNGIVFTGDTVFREAIGRTDLPSSANRSCLVAYLKARIMTLPDDTRILPGHGSLSTVGHERQSNPFLQNDDAHNTKPPALGSDE